MKKPAIDFQAIINEASEAAQKKMDEEFAAKGDYGSCGFVYVVIPPKEPIVKLFKEQDWGYKSSDKFWGRGWFVGVSKFAKCQSQGIMEDGAEAFVAVLAKYGIPANVYSRMD